MISSDIRRRLLGSQNRLVSLGSQCQRWSLLGLNVNSRLAPLLVDTFFAHQGRFAISGSTPGPSTLASSPSLRFVSSSAFVISAWISSGLLTSHSIILPASHPLPPLTQGRFSGPTPESSTLASCLTLHLILNSAFVIAFWLGFPWNYSPIFSFGGTFVASQHCGTTATWLAQFLGPFVCLQFWNFFFRSLLSLSLISLALGLVRTGGKGLDR